MREGAEREKGKEKSELEVAGHAFGLGGQDREDSRVL